MRELPGASLARFADGPDGHIWLMNRAAERVVKAADTAFKLRNGHLSLSNRGLNSRLHTAIRKTALASLGGSSSDYETVMVQAAAGAFLSLIVVPLPSDVAPAGPLEPLAAVLASEPSVGLKLSPDLVRAKYGLTVAEMRVLLAILQGKNLAGHAAEAGVSINTINTQVKAVFAKTGCHRQVDLVATVLGDPILRMALK